MKHLFLIILFFSINCLFAQTAEEHYQQAIKAYEQEEYKIAIKVIDEAIKLDSSRYDFIELKVSAFGELEKYEEIFSIYDKYISMFPDNPRAYFERGYLNNLFREYEKSIADYTLSLERTDNDSTVVRILSNRAASKFSIRDFESAYDDLLRCYQIDSTDLATLSNLGMVCDEVGRGDETLKYLLRSAEVDSTFFPAFINIGFKYQGMNEHENAVKYFDHAILLAPEEAYSYSNRSYSKLQLGDTGGALADIEKSLDLNPANSYAYRNLALIYLEMNKTEEVCVVIDAALELGFTAQYGNEVQELKDKYCNQKKKIKKL